MTPEPLFHLAIGSRFENIEVVQVALGDCLGRLGVEEDLAHWIDVAVREAVANAIKHGNRQDPSKKVRVGLSLDEGALVIRIEDQGRGFDPQQVPSPEAPSNRLESSGRGIFFMRSFMDQVEILPRTAGGTVVILRKQLATSAPEGGPKQVTQHERRVTQHKREEEGRS